MSEINILTLTWMGKHVPLKVNDIIHVVEKHVQRVIHVCTSERRHNRLALIILAYLRYVQGPLTVHVLDKSAEY